jgi:hypothetical protein
MQSNFFSSKKPVTYSNQIDFDEASRAWRENKKCLKNGRFAYICGKVTKTGNRCERRPKENESFCFQHIPLS